MKRYQFYKTRKSQTTPTVEQAEKNEDYKKNMNSLEERNHNIEKNYDLKLIVKNENNANKELLQEKINNKNKEVNNNSDEREEKNSPSKKNHEEMDNLFNEVEKFNAKNILKGDLAEMYDEIIKENSDFKENIFFVNLNHYENLIGNCDNKVIQHSFKEYKKEELLKNKYLPSKELYNKYDKKAKIIREKNEF